MYAEARRAMAALHAVVATAVAAFDDVMKHCPPLDDPDDPPVADVDPFAAARARVELVSPVAVEVEPEEPERRRPGRPRKQDTP